MKKLALIVAVAALSLTLAPLAVAGAPGGGGWKHGKAKFNLIGIVITKSVADTVADPAAVSTVTIKVKAGTKTVRAFRGHEAVMNVAADAKIWMFTGDGRVAATLSDVPDNARVKVRGVIDRSGATPVFTVKSLKFHQVAPPPAE